MIDRVGLLDDLVDAPSLRGTGAGEETPGGNRSTPATGEENYRRCIDNLYAVERIAPTPREDASTTVMAVAPPETLAPGSEAVPIDVDAPAPPPPTSLDKPIIIDDD